MFHVRLPANSAITFANMLRASDQMWVDRFQIGVLSFHVAIMIEYAIVHYSGRQRTRQKQDEKERIRRLMAFDIIGAAGLCV